MKKALIIITSILISILIFCGSILLFSSGELKYTEEIEVNQPLSTVSDLFEDIYNMKKYFPTTKDIILIHGDDGEEGAEYKIINSFGEETMEMSAILKAKNLPDSITYLYQMPGVFNLVTQKHKKILDNKTLVINEQEFKFKGIPKIIWFFKPEGFESNAFKAQTKMYLELFKSFVEK